LQGVTNLNKWEGTLRFDGSVLEVRSINVGYFLKTTPGSFVFNGSDPVPNSTGSFQAGATDEEYYPESGSGVLARVGLKALSQPEDPTKNPTKLYFSLWWPWGISGVMLEDPANPPNPIGDLDGDTYFDGLVFNAIVVVGDDPCPADADLDGFNNVEESIDGSDLLNADSTPEMCDGVDNDLDGLTDEWYDRDENGTPDCVDLTGPDDDNDGYTDVREAYLATDSLADCPLTLVYHAAWPRDISNDRYITIPGDVLKYAGTIGAASGEDRFRRRLDLNGDDYITVPGDVSQFAGHLNETCS